MLEKEIPEHLKNTYSLLTRAFPNGVTESQYLHILGILYEHMSDRNLSEIVSLFTNKSSSVVKNDIYKVKANNNLLMNKGKTEDILKVYGFMDWINED
ncbi:hypothetical protein [Neobacillus sp. DY30]|uniref:hypothetical protein n=1 Tax=Neobacillus sp. DY30 TaxID=3047871 RepID=UPI0024C07B51|nr:hypothetical protein [Neobacillus sp. DY30]WHX98036.1 hypothetical protein QNH29_15270 [Neobacillus sp. DY30]